MVHVCVTDLCASDYMRMRMRVHEQVRVRVREQVRVSVPFTHLCEA